MLAKPMNLRTTLARAAIITAACLASLGAAPQAVAAATLWTAGAPGTVSTATDAAATVTLDAELLDTPLDKDGEFRVSLTVSNATADSVPAGHVIVSAANEPFASRSALASFLDVENDSTNTPTTLDTIDVPELAPHTTWTSTPVVITAEELKLPEQYGAYAVAGTYAAASTTAQSRDAFVYAPKAPSAALDVAVAMPITVPPETNGLISSETLASATATDGLLTRQLDGAINRPVALGIDPRIVASIRALGSAAPDSAVEWLERLENASNDTFPLQYADADPTAQTQAGATTLLSPSSLAYGLDPANFTAPEPTTPATKGPTQTPGTSALDATPTPEPTTDEEGVPTLDTLLAFPYTFTSIVWPDDNTVTTDDIATITQNELGPTIVASSNTDAGAHVTAPAAATVGDASVLVSDSSASDALRRAVTATGDTGQSDALAALAAELAVMSGEPGANGRRVLLTLDRTWPTSSDRLSSVLTELSRLQAVTPTPLSDIEPDSSAAVKIDDARQSDSRLASIEQATSRDEEIAAFSSVLSDPSVLIGRHDAAKLTLLSIGWRADDSGWTEARASFEEKTTDTLNSVTIVRSSPILMIADQISIKIAVRNSLDLPVNVVMRASPDNPRLVVTASDVTEIAPRTQQSVSIPVTARLGNGDVNLRLELFSPTGVSIANSSVVPVTVRADWERIGTIILIVGVTLLFVFGLIRTILRRRRENRAETESEGDETMDAAAPASDATKDADG